MKKISRNGFTIIEVSLVLAIAGLIFLMVFVALPGLRASQRDTERREDIMSFLEKVKDYQTNNRGAIPGSSDIENISGSKSLSVNWDKAKDEINNAKWAGFYKEYLGEDFIDPDGVNYTLDIMLCGVSSVDSKCVGDNSTLNDLYNMGGFPFKGENGTDIEYTMVVVLQATCHGSEAVSTSNPRKLAVLYKLEGAGVYCNNT